MRSSSGSVRNATVPTAAATLTANEGLLRHVGAGPGLLRRHVHHRASLDLFVQFDRESGCCGAHSLAEVYATLTRMPGRHRISGEQAMLFVGSLRERLTVVALDGDEVARALSDSAR